MAKTLLHFLITSVVFLLLAQYLPGFHVDGWGTAILAALALGVVNVTLGTILKILTFPILLLSLGLFSFVINAILIMVVAFLIPGLSINGFWPALVAAVVLSGVNLLFKAATAKSDDD
jgi:putative membrane protein